MCKIIDDYIKIGEAKKEAEVNERVATDMIRDKYPLDAIKDINVPINSKLGKITIGNLVDKIYSPRTAAGVVGGGLAGAALGSYLMSDKENK